MNGAAVGLGCCFLIVGIAIGVMISAVILRAAVKWVVKFDLPFGPACGIVLVACLAARVDGLPPVTMVSTFSRTKSAARPGSRSSRASPSSRG